MLYRLCLAACCLLLAAAPAPAQIPPGQAPAPGSRQLSEDDRAYDTELMRLVEILGAVHYLRALCGAGEGQTWRDQMRGLVESEGLTPLRRARLVEMFNRGYRGYARTHRSCTRSAVLAAQRFMTEGTSLSDALLKANR